ncbi:hypothetical protein [Egicoccus sp. AB-alg6-2]|uniref:hypothetical protein n=1 Tax=Egicoccus sp. AB-alg6-2 TaxID=3242692 RepID=UPI00359E4BFF
MLTWVVVAVTAIVAVAVLALLVIREPVVPRRSVAAVTGPEQVRRTFRYVWPGYDPAEVDAHLAAAAQAWDDDRGGGRDRLGGATSERSERDDRGGGREQLREELEDGGGDGAGGLDR